MTSMDQAHKIIVKHQKKGVPIHVVPLAEEFGIKVYRVNDSDNFSGMIVKDKERGGSSGYAIFVNTKHPVARRRFTIAHEIAHFILHRSLIGDGISDDALYRSGLGNKIESAANKYAANILMPMDLIYEAILDGDDTIEKLADHFQVSRSAVAARTGIPD